MNATLELCKVQDCGLEIIGKEQECNQYTSEFTNSNKDFTYLQSITINQITKLNTDEEAESIEYLTVPHQLVTIDNVQYNDNDIATYTFTTDGLYKVIHMILPTKEWLDAYITANASDTSALGSIFYYNGGKVYQYSNSTSTEVDLDDLFEVNCIDTVSFVTTELYTFSVCNLMTCFYNVCKELLNNLCPANCNKTSAYSDLIYERDILWMALNVIKYLLEKGSYFEALRILDQITDCTGFCNNTNSSNSGGSGCGCHANN